MTANKHTFGFRISGYYAGGSWDTSEPQLNFVLPGLARQLTVNLPASRDQDDRQPIVFLCCGFPDETEAREIGARVKIAVMLAAAVVGFGIDLGNDEEISPALTSGGQTDETLQPQVHGLQVFPELDNMWFGSFCVHRPRPKNLRERFETTLEQAYALRTPVTVKESLAAQLYAHSHFQPLDAARLLLLVAAVEALADPPRRSAEAIAVVETMMACVRSSVDLDPSEAGSLASQLSVLKRNSIRSTCRDLVRSRCDEVAEQHFLSAYDIRSTLLHEGRIPNQAKIAPLLRALGSIVRRILVGQINERTRS